MKTNNQNISSSSKAKVLIQNRISFEKEETWTLSLNTLKNPIVLNRHFIGTLDTCIFHPRDIFKSLIKQNAHSYILFHSHPSGDPSPSTQDIIITENMIKASNIMNIELLDHIILSKKSYYSFKDNKLLF